jgi:RNA polymerase sigma-70 factor (ECF subfamily)
MANFFPSTHYSVLAGIDSDEPQLRAAAWERFSDAYWQPAFRYLCLRWRLDREQAEDWTQEFFAGLLAKEVVERYEPSRGSFHNYLRVCLDNHVRSRLSAKRPAQPLDFDLADSSPSPEEIFLREWQREIMSQAVAALEKLAEERGKQAAFAIFSAYDLGSEERPSYDELAARHAVPVTQVTNYLAWARRELRRLALERLASLSMNEREYRAEARRLFAE